MAVLQGQDHCCIYTYMRIVLLREAQVITRKSVLNIIKFALRTLREKYVLTPETHY